MDVIEGKTFKNQEIFMDFAVWRKCNFVDCKLIVEHGIFKIQNCDFIKSTWLFPKGTPAGLVYEIVEKIHQQKE